MHGEYYRVSDSESETEKIYEQNPDVFLTRIYKYYYGGGYTNMILSSIINILSILFFIFFTAFLFTCVIYDNLFMCSQEIPEQCQIITFQNLKTMHWFTIIYIIICTVYFISKICSLFYIFKNYMSIKRFYEDTLGISDFELGTITWSNVVSRITTINEQNNIFTCVSDLNPHNIANIIMRKENYLVAMHNKDIINFTVPFFGNRLYTHSVEWCVNYCIINSLFDLDMKLKHKFLSQHNHIIANNISDLNRRFRIIGIVYLIFMPFILVYTIIHTMFTYGEKIYHNPSEIGLRRWTTDAIWKFREFNELQHVVDERLRLGSKYTNKYLEQFSNKYLDLISRYVIFVLGSVLITMFLFTLINEYATLHLYSFAGKSALWWFGILGAIIALSKKFVVTKKMFYPHLMMNKVARFIHYIPVEWEQNADTKFVKIEFEKYYKYQIMIVLEDIIGTMLIPYFLISEAPKFTPSILELVREFTKEIDQVGYVCEFAMFDFTRNGDVDYGCATITNPYRRCNDGKLEKSYINFKLNNPRWIHQALQQNKLLDSNVIRQCQGPPNEHLKDEYRTYVEMHRSNSVIDLQDIEAQKGLFHTTNNIDTIQNTSSPTTTDDEISDTSISTNHYRLLNAYAQDKKNSTNNDIVINV